MDSFFKLSYTGFVKERLVWKEESQRTVFTCPIFSVTERSCRSPNNKLGTYTVLDSSDWAIVIPELDTEQGKKFLMVRQWRHGARDLSLEFPGGVFNRGENALEAAGRELREETGYTALKMEKLGEFNPNPAIMSNRVYFFLATELEGKGVQELDEDEYLEVETVPWEEVLHGMGKPPYIHALMGTAMSLYLAKT